MRGGGWFSVCVHVVGRESPGPFPECQARVLLRDAGGSAG